MSTCGSVRGRCPCSKRISRRGEGAFKAGGTPLSWVGWGGWEGNAVHPRPGLLLDPAFQAGIACLAPLGLSFDTYLYHMQLRELAALARRFPDTTIIVNHLGGPLGVGRFAGRGREVFDVWRQGIRELAQS